MSASHPQTPPRRRVDRIVPRAPRRNVAIPHANGQHVLGAQDLGFGHTDQFSTPPRRTRQINAHPARTGEVTRGAINRTINPSVICVLANHY